MAKDLLERTAILLHKSEWELFSEICEVSEITNVRRDAWWDAWCMEDWIPPLIEAACEKIWLGTVFKGEKHG